MNPLGEAFNTGFFSDRFHAAMRKTGDNAVSGSLSGAAGESVRIMRTLPRPALAPQLTGRMALATGPPPKSGIRTISPEGIVAAQSGINETPQTRAEAMSAPLPQKQENSVPPEPSEVISPADIDMGIISMETSKEARSSEEMAETGNIIAPLMSNAYNPFIPQNAPDIEQKERDVEAAAQSQPADNDSLYSENIPKNTLPAQRPSQPSNKNIIDNIETVSKRAERTNRMLEQRHLPYRFRVYAMRGQRVLIDMSILNDKGEPTRKVTRDITDENFGKIMDDVSDGKGLFLDSLPRHTTYYR